VVDNDMKDVAPGEVGEIVGRGTLKAVGYYKKPELTAQTVVDGWIRTGDLGRLDEEGYLYLVGRKKDMIVSGGINVYPEDIEEIMIRHPKILEVSVFGVPHEKWGETPRAAVVLKEGQEAMKEEILEWTNAQLARYQKISDVDFMKGLPRNPSGKVLKRELRAPYWKGLGREI
jgi:acyl-CoA synthetase (AMP-forming)/AMP-acid ligase II